MQEIFEKIPNGVEQFRKSLSAPRFGTYLAAAGGNEIKAIELYQWNSLVSQSLYVYLQSWEICLRNKVSDFLIWKYKEDWPYNIRTERNLKGDDKRRLTETKLRQERDRGICPVPTSVVVADLTAGFWVSQLSTGYDIPYSWRYNLQKIFPNESKIARGEAWAICDRLLTLRNRVAHHEPIFHLPLDERRKDLARVVSAMCVATSAFADATCNFSAVWRTRP